MKQVEITIDGTKLKVPEGTTVLEAVKKLNKVVPTFCYHPKLPVFGGCRMCLVYEKRWRTNIIACATPVQDGMEIETEHPKTLEERKFVLEMLFTRHPLDCPICDKAGECDLQNWGTYYGPQKNPSSITPFDKIRPEEDWKSDYFEFVSNRCVLCLRCISVCKNVVGADALFQEERGFEILISPDRKPMDEVSSCEACGLCVDICPVGAILFKPFKFNARPWLLKETITTCGMCSVQCPVAVDHDGSKVYRIRSTADLRICAGAYLGYDIHSKNRLEGAVENGRPVDVQYAVDRISQVLSEEPSETAVIVSPYSSNETLQAVKKLQEKTGAVLTSTTTVTVEPVIDGFIQEAGIYNQPSEETVLNAEKIVVVGMDVADTNPVITYLFGNLYNEGVQISKRKNVIYIGNHPSHIKKFNPEIIRKEITQLSLEDFGFADSKTVVIYSTASLKGEDAFKIGKLLGQLNKEKGTDVLILPVEPNAVGVVNSLELEYLPAVIDRVLDGKIKNLLIFGEDIVDHIDEETLQEIFLKLDLSCVVTPFSDGLAVSSNIAVGSSIWMEEGRTTEGFAGKVHSKAVFKKFWTEKTIVEKITEKIKPSDKLPEKEKKEKNYYSREYLITPVISLWDFGYLGRRSDNLVNYRLRREIKTGVSHED
ncbi:2Fe-2S iron-sulfur cluster-binding protein [Persephonella sp.]